MSRARQLHEEREFRAATDTGEICGWLRDGPVDAPPALLLHGGPGLSEYLEALADELDGLCAIARYQQRGIRPSTEAGERDVATHVNDAVAVLDALGWEKAVVIGHSWGGYLVMHVAIGHSERLHGFVSLDPLGAVGDGGLAEFVANLARQIPAADRPRYEELEALETPTAAEREESFRMVWPYYFGDPSQAPPFPGFQFDMRSSETWESISEHFDERTLELGLPNVDVPFLLIHGEASPVPVDEARRSAALVPNARFVAVPGIGHWAALERPGLIRAEMEKFVATMRR